MSVCPGDGTHDLNMWTMRHLFWLISDLFLFVCLFKWNICGCLQTYLFTHHLFIFHLDRCSATLLICRQENHLCFGCGWDPFFNLDWFMYSHIYRILYKCKRVIYVFLGHFKKIFLQASPPAFTHIRIPFPNVTWPTTEYISFRIFFIVI